MSPRERHLPQIEQRERDQEWCEEIVEEFNGLIERVNELEKYRGKGGWNFRFRLCAFFMKELFRLIATGSFKPNQTSVDIEMSLGQYDRFKQVSPWAGWTIITISAVLYIVIEYYANSADSSLAISARLGSPQADR
jgi:hypothetical protein